MKKSKAIRLLAFAGATCATAALVATAAQGTGAWFTSSSDGSMSAHTGQITISGSNTNLSFTKLIPGEDQSQTMKYTTGGDANEDVWLVFPNDNSWGWYSYGQLTGSKTGSYAGFTGGGLGRYGHFVVSAQPVTGGGTATRGFASRNLQLANGYAVGQAYNSGLDANGRACVINADGDGGGDYPATSTSDTPPECGIPQAIKLVSNVPAGSTGNINVKFGVTGRWTAQNADVTVPNHPVQFQIVATQVGHGPLDPNF